MFRQDLPLSGATVNPTLLLKIDADTEVRLTHRWSGMDSNFRFRARMAVFQVFGL
jgi:hypothetical protein